MTGMVLDSWQQTQPTLTTSLDKTGRQKPRFLDISTCNTLFVQPFPDNSEVFDDDYHEDAIPTNLTVFSPPTPTVPSPSEGFIAGAMAKMKKSLNWPPVRSNQISPQYFFQTYVTPIMTNKQVRTAFYNLELKSQQREEEEIYCCQSMSGIYKRPIETQYASLLSKSALYITCLDITSDHIRVCQWAYKASPNTDSTASIHLPFYWSSLSFGNVQDLTHDMIRIYQRTTTSNDYIVHLSLHFFLSYLQSPATKNDVQSVHKR